MFAIAFGNYRAERALIDCVQEYRERDIERQKFLEEKEEKARQAAEKAPKAKQ